VKTDQLDEDQAAVELGRGASFTGGCIASNAVGIRLHGYPAAPAEPPAQLYGNSIDSSQISFAAAAPYVHGFALSDNVASNGIVPELLSVGAEQPELFDGRCQ